MTAHGALASEWNIETAPEDAWSAWDFAVPSDASFASLMYYGGNGAPTAPPPGPVGFAQVHPWPMVTTRTTGLGEAMLSFTMRP